MPPKPSLRALRRWYRASLGFVLFTAVFVVLLYVDSPTDALTQIAAWCALLAALLNAWSIRTNLRRRLEEEEE